MSVFRCLTAVLLAYRLFFPAPCAAEDHRLHQNHSGLSLQGFTGVLNTPSAFVTREGDFYGLYSNQVESSWRGKARFQDNYFFNVGFFDFAEVGGRVFDAPGVSRDLSASIKITTEPFTRDMPHLPVFAAGIQDISGGASYLKSSYAVVSKDLWRFRLSAGYGNGPDRMKGLFAGGEFKVHDWVYILADYDTQETNVGARLVLPYIWDIPISLTATAKTSLDYNPGNFEAAVGFSLPLDFKLPGKGTKKQADPKPAPLIPANAVSTEAEAGYSLDHTDILRKPLGRQTGASLTLAALKERLAGAGFMNVRTGESADRTAVIEYENQIFNHNELDAMGVVTGLAVENLHDSGFRNICIIIRKKDIRVLNITMPLAAAEDFFSGTVTPDVFREKVSISDRYPDDTAVAYTGDKANSSFLATSLELWPGLNTLVGVAENGGDTFEYRLSVKPDIFVNLWQGGLLNARWDIPVSWSRMMDDGRMYSVMERLMLFQGVRLLPDVLVNLGAGMLFHDRIGTMNEAVWQPGDGSHRIRAVQTWARDDHTKKTLESYLASYRYLYAPLDVSLEGTIGRFLYEDEGFSLHLRRYFGDTSFSCYYKNTTTTDHRRWEAVGVEFTFPLTLEKDMKHIGRMQLRGTEEWQYSQETTLPNRNKIDKRGALNYLPDAPLASRPILTGSLHNQYQNLDRMNRAYIMTHIERIRTAWEKYRNML